MHFRIINCIDFEPFIITINLDIVLSPNIFSTLILCLNVMYYSSQSMKFVFSKKKKKGEGDETEATT